MNWVRDNETDNPKAKSKEKNIKKGGTPGRIGVYAILQVLKLLHGEMGYISHLLLEELAAKKRV